ncbi:MAG TPA: Holliday junction branch migration protein RuvA [bacterium]|nr:Holliday junction branch migration protein RuvA [bacterium]
MISFLTGQLALKRENLAVVNVGGVGFKVTIPISTYRELPREGEPVTLQTILLVREDDLSLYGFATEEERDMFKLLQSISGVGAKLAMDVLSSLPVSRIVEAVQTGNTALFCQVPGIGKKRAERFLFDLRQLSHPLLLTPVMPGARRSPMAAATNERVREAIEALLALGCKPQEAQNAIAQAVSLLGEEAEVTELVKEGLRHR